MRVGSGYGLLRSNPKNLQKSEGSDRGCGFNRLTFFNNLDNGEKKNLSLKLVTFDLNIAILEGSDTDSRLIRLGLGNLNLDPKPLVQT